MYKAKLEKGSLKEKLEICQNNRLRRMRSERRCKRKSTKNKARRKKKRNRRHPREIKDSDSPPLRTNKI